MATKKPDTTTPDTIEPIHTDSAAALDALFQEASQQEQQGQQDQQASDDQQQQAQTDTIAADLADTLAMLATVAGPGMWWLNADEFERLWGKKVQMGIANSGAEIMRRHGLSLGGLMSEYGPYIALGGALIPSTLATVSAYKREKNRIVNPAHTKEESHDSAH